MKLATFEIDTSVGRTRRVGIVTDSGLVDATSARIAFHEARKPTPLSERIGAAELPANLKAIAASGKLSIELLQEAADFVLHRGVDATTGGARTVFRQSDVRLLAPILQPPGICCFITWPAHIEDSIEKGYTMLTFPTAGGKLRGYYKGNVDSIAGPGTVIPKPPYAPEIDVECELAAVVGTPCKDATIDEARESIFGYMIYNDVSFREIQNKEMKFGLGPTKGKDADGSNIIGPWLVTADEVGDPHNLEMSLTINGERKSSYNTSKMVWDHADLLAYISQGQTVKAGHMLTSGCYPGGSALDLNITLKTGDRVSLQIDKLGSLDSVIG